MYAYPEIWENKLNLIVAPYYGSSFVLWKTCRIQEVFVFILIFSQSFELLKVKEQEQKVTESRTQWHRSFAIHVLLWMNIFHGPLQKNDIGENELNKERNISPKLLGWYWDTKGNSDLILWAAHFLLLFLMITEWQETFFANNS